MQLKSLNTLMLYVIPTIECTVIVTLKKTEFCYVYVDLPSFVCSIVFRHSIMRA
jgi:hypothetical protein